MSDESSTAARRVIELGERAHKLRLEMLETPGLVEDLQQGLRDIQLDRTHTLEKLDREHDWR